MNLIMPMMFGLFALQFASGLSIYFIVSNVVGAAQSWLMNRRWKKKPLLVPATAEPVKTSKALQADRRAGRQASQSTPSKPIADDAGRDNGHAKSKKSAGQVRLGQWQQAED